MLDLTTLTEEQLKKVRPAHLAVIARNDPGIDGQERKNRRIAIDELCDRYEDRHGEEAFDALCTEGADKYSNDRWFIQKLIDDASTKPYSPKGYRS